MREQRITYSPALTLVPTYECFNRCTYCNFRAEPLQDEWLSLEAAAERLRSLPPPGSVTSFASVTGTQLLPHSSQKCVTEILILSGEVHPQSQRRSQWFQHIFDLCQLALDWGFLPHTNVGPLGFEEMEQLKTVNVSMGLMLEQLTPHLLETVHRHAPSKRPGVRLEQLDWAGRLKIPFTTGLLIGIGETETDRIQTLEAIAQSHQRWGHIQEVIIQPHSPGESQVLSASACDAKTFIETVAIARDLLPEAIAIQIPPNLMRTPSTLKACLEAGATDLGGIGPVDEVNPDYGHPMIEQLAQQLGSWGWSLQPRLPVHDAYLPWLSAELRDRCSTIQAAWHSGKD